MYDSFMFELITAPVESLLFVFGCADRASTTGLLTVGEA